MSVLQRHCKLIFLAVFLAVCIAGPQPAEAATGINRQLNYQARLLNAAGAIVADGTYNIEFKIYQDGTGCVSGGSAPCGGTLKWTETRTGSNKVTVVNGYFSVQLGEVTPFGTAVDWNQDTVWLSLNVGGSAASPVWDGEMTPFRRMAAAPYALNAGQLDGRSAADFLQLAPAAVQADASSVSSVFVNKTGAGGNIIQLQKAGSDVVTVGNSGNLTVKVDSATAFQVQDAGANPVMSVDTTNDRVGIGLNTPVNALHVDTGTAGSAIQITTRTTSGTTATDGLQLTLDGANNGYVTNWENGPLYLGTNALARVTIAAGGNVVVGGADATGALLVVDTKTGAGDPAGVDGGMYYNSSSKSFRCYMNGQWRSCVAGVVFANTAVPAAVANTTTETNFAQTYSIPANDCQPGRVYRVTAQGVYGTTSTAPTLNMRVKVGTNVLAATGANATTASMANREWRLEFQFICVAAGVAGSVEAGGTFTRFTSAIASVLWEMSNTAVKTVDTTTAQTLQISAQWGTANAANTITMRQLIVEASGP